MARFGPLFPVFSARFGANDGFSKTPGFPEGFATSANVALMLGGSKRFAVQSCRESGVKVDTD